MFSLIRKINMDKRTISGLKKINADYITGPTFSGVILDNFENFMLNLNNSVSNSLIQLGTTINIIDQHQNSQVVSVSGSFTQFGTTTSQLDQHQNLTNRSVSGLVSGLAVSFSDTRNTTNFLQNEIDLINTLAISSGNVDILYGISIAVLDQNKGLQTGITNLSIGTSINNSDANFRAFQITSGTSGTVIGVSSKNTDQSLNAYKILSGTSINHLDNLVQSDYVNNGVSIINLDSTLNNLISVSYIDLENNKVEKSEFDDLKTAYEITAGVLSTVDAAFTAFDTAQTLWNLTQTANNGTQQTEIDTLQGQIDSIDTRIDTIEEQLGISFDAVGTHFTTFGTSIASIDVDIQAYLYPFKSLMLGTTIPRLENVSISLGTSINNHTTLINNITGTTLFNFGTTTNNEDIKINNIGITVSSLGTSSATEDIKINQLGVSRINLATTCSSLGVSSSNEDLKINILGISSINLGNTCGVLGTSSSNQDINFNALGITVNNGISFSHLLGVSLGITTVNLDVNERLLSVSVANEITQRLTLGVSIGITSSNTDGAIRKFLGISSPQMLSRNEIVLPSTFTNASLTTNNSSNFQLNNSGGADSILQFQNFIAVNKFIGVKSGDFIIDNREGNLIINNNTTQHLNIDASTGNTIINNALTVSGVFQSPLTSLLTVSGVNTDIATRTQNITIGTSISVDDGLIRTFLGVSAPQFLEKNRTVLPSTFTNSSLTSFGTIGTLAISDNVSMVSNDTNCFLRYQTSAGTTQSLFGLVGSDLIMRNAHSGNIIFQDKAINQLGKFDTSGNFIVNNNLTVSGTFQSFQTSLLGTSSSVIDGKLNTFIGTSAVNYISRNENVLPSTFTSSSLNSLGTLSSLGITGNLTVSGIFQSPLTSLIGVSSSLIDGLIRTEIGVSSPNYLKRNEIVLPSSFINFGSSGSDITLKCASNLLLDSGGSNSYIQFRTGTLATNSLIGSISDDIVLRNSEGDFIFQKASASEISRLSQSGNWTMGGNLTVSGTFQSPLTSLLGVSIGVIDGKTGINIGVSIPQFLTRNEIILPNTFTNWGITSGAKQINMNDYVLFNSAGANSYLQIRGSNSGANNLLFGLLTDDPFFRAPKSTSNYKFQNSSANNIMTIDSSGNTVISGTLNSSSINTGSGSITCNSLASDTRVYNSGSSASFKIQGGNVWRFESQGGGEFYMWDNGDNQVYHISTDRQMWWQGDFNVAGTYYDSGVPIVPSSSKLKTNIKDIPTENTILDKLNFKKYTKTYKNKTYEEIGVVIEDLEKIPGIEDYNLIMTRESDNPEFNDLKYLKYVPFFMVMFNEMKNRIEKLERNNNV